MSAKFFFFYSVSYLLYNSWDNSIIAYKNYILCNSMSRYMYTKRIESRGSNKYSCTNVHSNIIHKSQKEETTQRSTNRWMAKQDGVSTDERRNEILIYALIWTNCDNVMLSERKADKKGQWFHLYKDLERQIHRQNVEQRPPGVGGPPQMEGL